MGMHAGYGAKHRCRARTTRGDGKWNVCSGTSAAPQFVPKSEGVKEKREMLQGG